MRNLTEIPKEKLPPAMAWLPDAIDSIRRATWNTVTGDWKLFAHVDPLRKVVYAEVVGDLTQREVEACRLIIKRWGEENNNHVRSVQILPGCFQIDVFHKERHGPPHNFNPFTAEGSKGRRPG